MKRILLLPFLTLFAFAGVFAQPAAHSKALQLAHQKAAPLQKTAFTGFEKIADTQAETIPPAANSMVSLVGTTVFDLQSNGAVSHRVYNDGNGNITALYNLSRNPLNSYADRGTGYNSNVGGNWGPDPTARIEPARTGFPNLVVTNGNEYIFSHLGAGKINMAKRAVGGTTWTHTTVPSATTELWARAAGGGSNGNTLHVIASTMPVSLSGTLFQGMDGVMLYWRSLDGGVTWDIKDMLLPGIDNTQFFGTEVEGYSIDANGDNVSILVTNTLNDCLLFTSTDNGTSWTKHIINDFPLVKYSVNQGYDTLSLPPDPNRALLNDPYAIFTSDGTGDVLVDNNGYTHVWYSGNYISDAVLNDVDANGNPVYTFYPGANIGMVYWNSLMADDSGVVVGYSPDINGNQAFDATDISNYGFALSSLPAASIDATGNLYLIYSTIHELYVEPVSGFNFRQPFIVGSQDFGTTWTEPQQVLNPALFEEDSVEIPFLEAIYNATAKLTDNKVHLVFQADYSPLTYLNSPMVDGDYTDNTIRYIGYPSAWVFGTSATNSPAESLKFKALPNPASDRVTIEFNSARTQESWVVLYDVYGKMVRSTEHVTVGSGTGTFHISTADLPTGMYVARLNLGNSFATQKVIVKH